jgi:hypothetical protein
MHGSDTNPGGSSYYAFGSDMIRGTREIVAVRITTAATATAAIHRRMEIIAPAAAVAAHQFPAMI